MSQAMRTTKKTYTLTSSEIDLLAQIRDRALSKKIILNDSLIVRIGIHLASMCSTEKLVKSIAEFEIKK